MLFLWPSGPRRRRKTEGLCADWPRAKTSPASQLPLSLFADSARVSWVSCLSTSLRSAVKMPRGSRSRTSRVAPPARWDYRGDGVLPVPWHRGRLCFASGRRGLYGRGLPKAGAAWAFLRSPQTGYEALGSFPVSANFLISNVHELFLNIF